MALGERITVPVNQRVVLFLGGITFAFFLLFIRLWYLQIVKGDYFRELSENNRIRIVYVPAPRGLIFDRNSELLVSSRPSFNIELIREDCPDVEGTIKKLSEILGISFEELLKRTSRSGRRLPFEPRLLLQDVDREVVAKISANRIYLPGVIITSPPARDYKYGELAAHLIGYIREITPSQLESRVKGDYRLGDIIGQYGIESTYEKDLRGVSGLQRIEVNANGTRIGEESFEPQLIGSSLYLTIDRKVQQAADDALATQNGAVVALNPKTGEILALASGPRFNPNVFTGPLPPDLWRQLSTGSGRILNNRATQGVYPPGSVYKIFMAVAALEEKITNPSEQIFCPGHLRFGNRNYGCHKRTGHGYVNLKTAIAQSCDVYFYTMGLRLGIDKIHEWSSRFGLGVKTGIEIAHEAVGIVPSTTWKRNYFRKPQDKVWYPGETLSVAIGQGAVSLTPIQITRGMAAVANGGNLVTPFMIKKIISNEGEVKFEAKPKISEIKDIKGEILKTVVDGMIAVVNDPIGTGKNSRLNNIIVAGKTGTAQVVALSNTSTHAHFKDHAWFSAFAPAEDPEIVVTVLAENAGHGGAAAAPIAKKVFEAYFGDRILTQEQLVELQKNRIN